MTDRELLELAAKAAGPLQGRHRAPIGEPAILCANDLYWCPLHDDGDALRLAVKLRFDLIQFTKHLRIDVAAFPDVYQMHEDDPYAATRRAIVRAAAEIGKSMKDNPALRTLSRLSDEMGEEL